jgi:hypothetical protein
LIFDVKAELLQFQEDAADMRDCEYHLNDILQEVFLFISDRNFLSEGIKHLRDNFYEMHAKDGYTHDGKIIADAVEKLARSLSDLLIRHNAYMPDGNFPYELRRWISIEYPVFEKNMAYAP